MADSDVDISGLDLTDRETEVEHKERIGEESSAINEGKAQAGFESPKQDPKKPVKIIKGGSNVVNEGKAEAGFKPPKRDPKRAVKLFKEESNLVNEGKAEAGFKPPKQDPKKPVKIIKEGSSVVNEGKAEAAFEPPKQQPKKKGKRPRKLDGRRMKYTSEGIQKRTQLDLCDCLDRNCPGCWLPCKECSSTKCGHECRRNRQWEYENIHIQGTSIDIKNEFKK